ncbi:MAG TPA: hypothetical protein DHW61_10345 [Lachnoclostridium phytofermentans]|uniref:PBS lyase HEAT domain protein repeat-containing protein n=1 Tax=Lachnoclostridium phytofermentans TaxID=66219 RepID=A0A3D2X6P0_9FIRM|nr:HEAT repeat domain-containing protein [Lachnoclostridium sp.]HCL02792.1 hypothetical protein [Lachnoclostridium phytofermentans]
MEQYIYISITFFSLIIFLLYIYILYEKISEACRNNKIRKHTHKIEPYIDYILNEIREGKETTSATLENIKDACNDKTKSEVIEEIILDRLESFDSTYLPKLTELCHDTCIVEHEINNLKSRNYFKKALAAKRLGEFRSKEAVQALLDEINVRNNDVTYNILLALAKIGDEPAFIKAFEGIDASLSLSERSLIEIVDSFEGDKNNIYKHMINGSNSYFTVVFIKSAGNSKNISLSKDISKYLLSENKELRIAAVKAMGNIGDEEYLDDIIELLKDCEWEVRALSAKALSNFTDHKILIPLKNALSDREWHVRYNAATTILNHKDGMSVVSSVFEGDDEFAKDIIISAIEHSAENKNYLHESFKNLAERKSAIMRGVV